MKILIILIILSQLLIWPIGLSFRWSKEVISLIGIVALLSSLIWKYNKPIACFVLWSLFVFIFHKSYVMNEWSSQFRVQFFSLLTLISIISFGVFYYILHHVKLNKELIYRIFCIVAVANVIYIFLQACDLDQFFHRITPWHQPKVSEVVGFWGNETLAGWSLAILSPFFLHFKQLRYKLGYVACFVAVFLTGSTTAIGTFIIGAVIVLYARNKRIVVAITVVLALLGAYGTLSGRFDKYLDSTRRFEVWKKTYVTWKASRQTIVGRGLGSYKKYFFKEAPEFVDQGRWAQAHNDYLQILYEQGIIGLGIILWFIYGFIKKVRLKNLIPATSVIIFGLIMLNGFPVRTSMCIIPIVSLVIMEEL